MIKCKLDKTVSSGQITLDAVPTTYVEIGLNYTPTHQNTTSRAQTI